MIARAHALRWHMLDESARTKRARNPEQGGTVLSAREA